MMRINVMVVAGASKLAIMVLYNYILKQRKSLFVISVMVSLSVWSGALKKP